MRQRWLAAAVLVVLAILTAGPVPAAPPAEAASETRAQAGRDGAAHDGPVRVVATIFPLTSIVREIGGDLVAVSTIVPAGADPHNFEITPTTARAIGGAQLLLSVAPAFDGWAVPAADDGGDPRGAAASSIVLEPAFTDSLIALGNGFNPHFWLDPVIALEIGRIVGRELCRLDPANCPSYDARAQVFAARMDSLHTSVKARLAQAATRDYVAVHPAWTYFARRYGLNERNVLERTPEQEPSAKWIAKVLKSMKRNNVRLVVAEEFSNMALATMVAKEAGAQLIVLDPLGGETRPGRDSYFALIDYNVSRLEAVK